MLFFYQCKSGWQPRSKNLRSRLTSNRMDHLDDYRQIRLSVAKVDSPIDDPSISEGRKARKVIRQLCWWQDYKTELRLRNCTLSLIHKSISIAKTFIPMSFTRFTIPFNLRLQSIMNGRFQKYSFLSQNLPMWSFLLEPWQEFCISKAKKSATQSPFYYSHCWMWRMNVTQVWTWTNQAFLFFSLLVRLADPLSPTRLRNQWRD